jgi:hypothetical protein
VHVEWLHVGHGVAGRGNAVRHSTGLQVRLLGAKGAESVVGELAGHPPLELRDPVADGCDWCRVWRSYFVGLRVRAGIVKLFESVCGAVDMSDSIAKYSG